MYDPQLEGKSFLSFLNALEGRVEPARMRTPEFNYWPIIRFAINYRRKMHTDYLKGSIAFTGETLFKNTVRGRLKIDFVGQARAQADQRKLNLSQCDVLFLTRKLQYKPMADGVLVQALVDGLRKITEAPAIKSLTCVQGDPRTEGERFFVETQELPSPSRFRPRQYLKPRDAYEYRLRRAILRNLARVNRHLEVAAPQLVVDPWEILHRIEVTTLHFYHWTHMLNLMEPKIIYLSSFSGAHYVCAAARRLGIAVVDIQHGGMNPYHPIICNWSNAPRRGYELLPDIFWCWNSRSASYIQFAPSTAHRAVIGGNPKTVLEFHTTNPAEATSYAQMRERGNDKRRILVALQYGAETLVRPHVTQIFKAQKDRFDWVFRLHPMGWDRADEAVEKLGLDRAQLEADSRVPLHVQLPQVDLVLTNASTIVFEALEYGTNAAVCSSIGAKIFDSLIAEGELSCAETEEQLADLLDRIAAKQNEKGPVPDRAADIAVQNLQFVREQYANLLSDVGIDTHAAEREEHEIIRDLAGAHS